MQLEDLRQAEQQRCLVVKCFLRCCYADAVQLASLGVACLAGRRAQDSWTVEGRGEHLVQETLIWGLETWNAVQGTLREDQGSHRQVTWNDPVGSVADQQGI